MDYVGFVHSSPKSDYNRASKKCLANFSPEKLTFAGNFTQYHRHFDICSPDRGNMRRDILEAVMKRTESIISRDEPKVLVDDNPMYEDPRDVIGEKPPKPPRKRNVQGSTSPQSNKEGRSLLKEQKRKLTKKYEGLITALMDRCEENMVAISEKDSQVTKLKDKLKSVLEFNKLFAEENDQLKAQHSTLIKYVEECKRAIKEEKGRNEELESRSKELEERVKKYEVPHREHTEPLITIPLVEVCMSCSSRQIIVNQAREQNARLQKDMLALKDVLYRLNVQLSRYQEKLRGNVQTLTSDGRENIFKPGDGLDSLIAASLGCRQDGLLYIDALEGLQAAENIAELPSFDDFAAALNMMKNAKTPGMDSLSSEIYKYGGPNIKEAGNMDDGHSQRSGMDEQTRAGRVVDLSGLLSAQALAPLFDAYQENLQEKDSLILDYEKQFENINKKSKQMVLENKSLLEKVNSLEEELVQVRQSYKKLVVERETADIERATMVERADRAESKLKEVYELYEDKMAAMMRDYETVHREYFSVKNALEATEGKMAQIDVLRARTVPADLHERRLDHCKRLLEELKHQYSMENERRIDQTKKLEEQLRVLQEKYNKICHEDDALKEELATALKNVRLYRKAAVIFRQRVKAATARMTRVRRSARSGRRARSDEPLRHALDTLDKIKSEIKVVKSRAHTSLEELERRIVEQERRAAHAQHEYRRELSRASVALQHKDDVIRHLIDKVADVEEVRLSQTNTHRLQGIISDSSPELSKSPKGPERERADTRSVKLVPGPGGYFQDKERKKGNS